MKPRLIGFIFGCVLASLALITVTAQVSSFPPRVGASVSNTWMALQTFAEFATPLPVPAIANLSTGTSGSLAAGTYYLAVVSGSRDGFSALSDEVSAVIDPGDDGTGSIALQLSNDDGYYGIEQFRVFVGTAPGVYDVMFVVAGPVDMDIVDLGDGVPAVMPAANGSRVSIDNSDVSFMSAERVYTNRVQGSIGTALTLRAASVNFGGLGAIGASLDLDQHQNNFDGTFTTNGFHLLGGESLGTNAGHNLESRIQGGLSTGNQPGGPIVVMVSSPGVSGAQINDAAEVFRVDHLGAMFSRVYTAAPAAGDCNDAAETGRFAYDSTADEAWICSGASGWRKIATAAP